MGTSGPAEPRRTVPSDTPRVTARRTSSGGDHDARRVPTPDSSSAESVPAQRTDGFISTTKRPWDSCRVSGDRRFLTLRSA